MMRRLNVGPQARRRKDDDAPADYAALLKRLEMDDGIAEGATRRPPSIFKRA